MMARVLAFMLWMLFATNAFASDDPVKANANPGANFNRYAYANNNPYRFTDPDGRQSRDLENEYRVSGAKPPTDGAAPNLLAWGAVEVACGFCNLNYTAPQGSGALQPIVTPMETAIAGGVARGLAGMASAGETSVASIATPRGAALQSSSPEATAALQQVQSGAPIYRAGSFGTQNTGNGQFWSMQNPTTTSGYASQMGMPGSPSQSFDWVIQGRLPAGAPVITRPAPGIGSNAGGSIEAVVNPGTVRLDWFSMP